MSALEESQRISDYKFGFHRCYSTVLLLLTAINDWSLSLEHRSNTNCVFLDFAKAFDSVPHARLLLKLSSLGILKKVKGGHNLL